MKPDSKAKKRPRMSGLAIKFGPTIRLVLLLALLAIPMRLVAGCESPVRETNLTPTAPTGPPALRVGVHPQRPPLIYRQSGGLIGLEADLAAELGRTLGRPVQFVELGPDDLFPALADGRIDIVMSGLTASEPYQKRASLTDPYLRSGQMAMVHREYIVRHPSLPALLGGSGRVGVVAGSVGESFVPVAFRHSKMASYRDIEEAMAALKQRQVDVVVDDAPYIMWIQEHKDTPEIVAVPMTLSEEYMAWGVKLGNDSLRQAVNRALDTLRKNGRLELLIKRWLPQTQGEEERK